MTWTYSGDPSASPLDAVRFLIRDTNPADPLLQDEEILYILNQSPVVEVAAWKCAEIIAGNFSWMANSTTIGDYSVNYGNRFQIYNSLSMKLRRMAALKIAVPYAGGISVGDKENVQSNPDRVTPKFRKDTMEDQNVMNHDVNGDDTP